MKSTCDVCGAELDWEELYILGKGKYCWKCRGQKRKQKVSPKLSRLMLERQRKIREWGKLQSVSSTCLWITLYKMWITSVL